MVSDAPLPATLIRAVAERLEALTGMESMDFTGEAEAILALARAFCEAIPRPVIPHSHELCDGCLESVEYEESLRALGGDCGE